MIGEWWKPEHCPDLDAVLSELEETDGYPGERMGPLAEQWYIWYQRNPQGHPYDQTGEPVTKESMREVILWMKERKA